MCIVRRVLFLFLNSYILKYYEHINDKLIIELTANFYDYTFKVIIKTITQYQAIMFAFPRISQTLFRLIVDKVYILYYYILKQNFVRR